MHGLKAKLTALKQCRAGCCQTGDASFLPGLRSIFYSCLVCLFSEAPCPKINEVDIIILYCVFAGEFQG